MPIVDGVLTGADALGPEELVAHARRLEALGHTALWMPDVYGREIYVTAAHVLAHTSTLEVASGIAHVYGRDALASAQAGRTLSELSGGRFIQGLGVSHPVAAEMRGDVWIDPVTKARDYITEMRTQLPLHTPADPPPWPIYLAAHGPKMLGVAAEVADGANTYAQPPEHTAEARALLGPDKDINVVLPCCLTTDAVAARAAARAAVAIYLPLPAYQRRWAAQGFDERDWSGAGSDRLVDSYTAWGSIDDITARMRAHLDAGATRIVLRPVNPDPTGGEETWEIIEAFAPA